MKSVMNCVQHNTRVIPMKVKWTTGTPSIGEGFAHASISDTGTGIATITFNNAFARVPTIIATCEAATGEKVTAALRSVAQDSFILEVTDEAGALSDSTVYTHILIIGFDSADEV